MFLTIAFAATVCTSPHYAQDLLAANRAATVRSQAAAGVVEAIYDYSGGGMSGIERTVTDLDHGAYLRRRSAGMTSESEGFDGTQAWQRDLSGFATLQDGGNVREIAVGEAYRVANLWWRKDAGGAVIAALGCDHLSVTPAKGQRFEAWFDPDTHLLRRVREKRTYGSVGEKTFRNYVERNGRLVAAQIDTIYNDSPASLEVLKLRSWQRLPKTTPRMFSVPAAQPADWTLVGGSVTVPFRLLNNHIIVDVRVNGEGPFPFLVDTGGHNILTPSTLEALRIEGHGRGSSSGAGAKRVTNGYARVGSLELGGVMLKEQTVYTLDFSPIPVEGLQLGGMLGVEFLERFVVQVDYGAGTVTIVDPKRRDLVQRIEAGTPITFTVYGHMPQIMGMADRRPVRLNIDTGSRSEIDFTSPFTASSGLDRQSAQAVNVINGWGVGGPTRSRLVRTRQLTLGPIAVHDVISGLSQSTSGSFSDEAYDGNVGSGLMKRFTVTFDYSQRRMYLQPNAHPDEDVGRFDRSGMWLNLGRGGMEVMDVASNGPADQGGLAVGDILTAIDGKILATRSLSEVRRWLKLLPVGRPVVINYLRNGTGSSTTIRPRNIIPD
jgi:hypothetical protein